MRKLAIANRKGGVGKTTTAVHLAYGLAEAGRKVLLVDSDPQGNVARMLGLDPVFCLEDLLRDEEGALYGGFENGLHVLPSTPELAPVAQAVLNRPYNPQLILSEKLAGFTDYDYVILDTAPSYSALAVNVLFYADEVLVPVNMEVLATDGFKMLSAELEEMRAAGAARIRYILPTMFDGRKGLSSDILDGLTAAFNGLVTLPIRYSARFSELADEGRTIFDADPKNRGALDYAKLCGVVARG